MLLPYYQNKNVSQYVKDKVQKKHITSCALRAETIGKLKKNKTTNCKVYELV